MKVWVDANPTMVGYVTEEGQVSTVQLNMCTNNEAEYQAVIQALMAFPNKITEILSDSQLVVKQLNHEYSIKEDRLRRFAIQVWALSDGKVKFTWIRREDNKAGKLLG